MAACKSVLSLSPSLSQKDKANPLNSQRRSFHVVPTFMWMNLIPDFLIRSSNQKRHCLVKHVWSLLRTPFCAQGNAHVAAAPQEMLPTAPRAAPELRTSPAEALLPQLSPLWGSAAQRQLWRQPWEPEGAAGDSCDTEQPVLLRSTLRSTQLYSSVNLLPVHWSICSGNVKTPISVFLYLWSKNDPIPYQSTYGGFLR